MPVFTAAATALLSSTFLAGSTIATSILASGLAAVAGNVLGVFGDEGSGNVADEGVDVRLAPSTTNRIPVLYGKFQQRGIVNYFEVSEDKQKLYAVIILGEGPVSTIDSIYWEDLLLTLDADGVVTNAVDPDGTDVDRLNGKVTIMTYPTGGRSTFLEGNSDLWTSSHTMTDLAYAVVEATYDRENGVTGIPDVRFRGTAPISNPAEAVEDMFTNSTYGLGLDASFIDTASITAATNYFNELIDYVDTDGVDQMQKRAEVNGVLNTGDSVFDRVETILTGCNASLRWADGKWGIFLNKSDSAVEFNVDESNIIGSISVTETGLNNLYNAVEVQYGRDVTNNYQRGTVIRKSPASVLYPSEIDRKLTISLPLVHNSVEAAAVATVILNQGRQQLTVRHRLDATGMPLEAGDVVRYTDVDYGWSFKLFRIISTTEVNDGGILAYDIEAVEYADAVYDYGVLNETDVAPNVPPNNANTITAVNDLAVSGQFPNRSVPAVQLTWTVPSNSLIETFDVFFSVGGTQFNSATTVFAKSIVSTMGTFTAGATIVEDVANIPSGNITLWVVGRNDFVRSAESNGVTIANYQPNPTAAGTTIYRFNETPSVIAGVDIDVGAPPATETAIGVGRNNNSNDTGWYESELDADNRENAPVWTAVTTVTAADAEPRELDFTFSGTSGDTVTTDTPVNQIIDFELTGNIGDRELQYPARPEITRFTFSGQAAEADSVDPGLQEVWQIDVTGSTDASNGVNEEFYILPAGTSDLSPATTVQLQVSELSIDETITLEPSLTGQPLLDDIETKLAAITSITNQFVVSQDTATIGGNSVTIVKLVAIPAQNLSLALTINSGITGTTSGTLVDGVVSTTATSITLTYDPDILPVTQMLTFGENATSVQVAAELTALIDGHGDLEATQGDTFTEVEGVVEANLEPSSDFTFRTKEIIISSTVTGTTAARVVLDSTIQEDITRIVVRRGAGEPAVGSIFGLANTSFSTGYSYYRVISTFDSAFARVSTVEFIKSVGVVTEFVANENCVTTTGPALAWVDSFINETVSTVFIEDLTSSSILIKPDITGDQTEPTITINTQGTGDAAFAVSTQLEGRIAVAGSPAFTEYVVSYDGIEINRDAIPSARFANNAVNSITTAINTSTELTATASGSVITVTSTANSAAGATISIISGINESGKTSTNDLAVSRAVTNFGSATDVFAGVDSTVTVRVSGEVYYTDTFNATDDTIPSILDDLEVGIDAIVPGFDLDERWDGDVQDTSTIRATALATGTDPTITISIAAGSTATVDSIGNITTTPATLNSTATVIDDGVNVDITDGELSNFTVTQGTNELISAMDITGNSSASSVVSQIAIAIAANTESVYTTSASNLSILATLIENNNVPDLTISVSPGLNADNTASDLAVARTVIQEGSIGTIDLTDAVWTYFISAPTTDGDTTMIGTDGTIQVRRGLVLDTTAAEEISGATETEVLFVDAADTHTTGSKPSTLVIQGSVSMPALTVVTAGAALGFIFEQSTDYDPDSPADATWTAIQTSVQVGLTAATAYVGQVVNVALPIATTFDAAASTTYFFRARRNGVSENTDLASGIAAGFLIIEELRS